MVKLRKDFEKSALGMVFYTQNSCCSGKDDFMELESAGSSRLGEAQDS